MRKASFRSLLRACAAVVFALSLVAIPLGSAAQAAPDSTEIQILTINDFHGRIEADPAQGLPVRLCLPGQ